MAQLSAAMSLLDVTAFTVRFVMRLWRLSQLQEPDAIDPKDKTLLFAEYKCLFGISKVTDGLPDGEMGVNHTDGFSTMVINGKGKVYWFMFKKMDKVW